MKMKSLVEGALKAEQDKIKKEEDEEEEADWDWLTEETQAPETLPRAGE